MNGKKKGPSWINFLFRWKTIGFLKKKKTILPSIKEVSTYNKGRDRARVSRSLERSSSSSDNSAVDRPRGPAFYSAELFPSLGFTKARSDSANGLNCIPFAPVFALVCASSVAIPMVRSFAEFLPLHSPPMKTPAIQPNERFLLSLFSILTRWYHKTKPKYLYTIPLHPSKRTS